MVAPLDLEGLGVEGEENNCCQQSKTSRSHNTNNKLPYMKTRRIVFGRT
jgi:hypothetical protein